LQLLQPLKPCLEGKSNCSFARPAPSDPVSPLLCRNNALEKQFGPLQTNVTEVESDPLDAIFQFGARMALPGWIHMLDDDNAPRYYLRLG
jgi:hypothetical protein